MESTDNAEGRAKMKGNEVKKEMNREPGWYWVKMWTKDSDWMPRYCDGGDMVVFGDTCSVPAVFGDRICSPGQHGKPKFHDFIMNTHKHMDQQKIGIKSLSRVTGMSESHISGIMTGRVGVTLRTIERFAKVFGVQPREML